MASMRDIKRRRESIQSTGQITKAMKLVSTVKLQKAKSRAEEAKPYFAHLYSTIARMFAKSSPEVKAHYMSADGKGKTAVIVMTSNRGLAGGYNANIGKLVREKFAPDTTWIYAVGRKGRDDLARKGYSIKGDYSEVMNAPLYKDAAEIATQVMEAFEAGEVGEIYLAFTIFRNTVSHVPTLLRLLPVDEMEVPGETPGAAQMNFEPQPEEALSQIIPKYVAGEIYGALIEALASENGARMQAMDNATNNAEDMMANLSLQYNRARQGSITQELTEIIAGANAIQ